MTLSTLDLVLLATCILGVCIIVYQKLYRSTLAAEPLFSGSIYEKVGAGQVSDVNNNKSREAGEWIPVSFEYPQLRPVIEDVVNIKPIPYRPFRWGEYHVTMGIRNMMWDEWIELDRDFVQYYKIREDRIRTRGDRAVRTLPSKPGVVGGGHAPAVELVHELAEYLSRRYPTTYTVTRYPSGNEGWYGLAKIRDITIIPVSRTFVLDEEDPIVLSALLIQEDLAVMVEGSDGRYYFQAGAILIPGTWRMEDKIGMPLDEIHISGNVPQFESKLNVSMGRFLKRMPVEKPVVRNNYTFQIVRESEGEVLDPAELAWAKTMKGDEDLLGSEGQRWLEGVDEKDEQPAAIVPPLTPEATPSRVWLRTERQTLRRLPKTGAIIFTIRVYQTPMRKLVQEPGIPGRMASAIRSWPEDVARYKAKAAYEGIVEYLDECHAEQETNGVYKEGLTVAYPY